MFDYLILWDQYLFGIINNDWTHPLLDNILPLWRTKTTWIPLYLVLLISIGRKHPKRLLGILLVIAATILISDQVSSQWIKKTVQRLRPCRNPELDGVRTLVHCGGGFSFTSSHATNHFALAMQLFLLFRQEWSKYYFVLLFVWAAVIGYAQIYVGVHYPLDILGGSLLGCAIAVLVSIIASYIYTLLQKQYYEK
jgi:undecaprenyl-diphosphatase